MRRSKRLTKQVEAKEEAKQEEQTTEQSIIDDRKTRTESSGTSDSDYTLSSNYDTHSTEDSDTVVQEITEQFASFSITEETIQESKEVLTQPKKRFGKTNFSLAIKYKETEDIPPIHEEEVDLYPISSIILSRGQSHNQGHHVLAFGTYEMFLQLKLLGVPINQGIIILLLAVESVTPNDISKTRLRGEHKEEESSARPEGIEKFREICITEIEKVKSRRPSKDYIRNKWQEINEATEEDFNNFWRTYIDGEAARWLFALQYCAEEYIKLLDSNPIMRFGSDEDIRGEGARVKAGLRLFSAIISYIECLNIEGEENQHNFWQYAISCEEGERISPDTSFRNSLGLSIRREEIDNPPVLFSLYGGNNSAYVAEYLLPIALSALIDLPKDKQVDYPRQIANALYLVFDLLEEGLIAPCFNSVMAKIEEKYGVDHFQAQELRNETINLLCLQNHLLRNYLSVAEQVYELP